MLLGSEPRSAAVPLWLVTEGQLPQLLAQLDPPAAAWLRSHGFQAERARMMTAPDGQGGIAAAVGGLGSLADPSQLSLWDAAACAERLPAGNYALATDLPEAAATQFALGWLLGSYRFNRFRSQPKAHSAAHLVRPDRADAAFAENAALAIGWWRDLINTPAQEMGPAGLSQAARTLAEEFGGQFLECTGDELRRQYPLVHAVGQGSSRPPRPLHRPLLRAGAPPPTPAGQ